VHAVIEGGEDVIEPLQLIWIRLIKNVERRPAPKLVLGLSSHANIFDCPSSASVACAMIWYFLRPIGSTALSAI
jgi:hypothetical protein